MQPSKAFGSCELLVVPRGRPGADVPSLPGSIPRSVIVHVLLHAHFKFVARYNIAIVPFFWSQRLIEAYVAKDLQ